MGKRGQIWVGTSGWSYDHWIGPFYPKGTAASAFLPFYARRFASVEINSTFYGLPKSATLQSWLAQTPSGFLFACKASRYITHMKKLKDPEAGLASFLAAIEPLGPKLGPILFQLPPRWRLNAARLEEFLQALSPQQRYAFEFRDASWFADETCALLERYGAAFCCYDLAGWQSPREVTSDYCYVRLHGPADAYAGCYDDAALADWSQQLLTWSNAGHDCYCYFDNDEKGYAARNARRLLEFLHACQAQVAVAQAVTAK